MARSMASMRPRSRMGCEQRSVASWSFPGAEVGPGDGRVSSAVAPGPEPVMRVGTGSGCRGSVAVTATTCLDRGNPGR